MERVLNSTFEFYSQPELRGRNHVASLLTLGAGALLLAALRIPYFNPPIGGDSFTYYVAVATVCLSGVAVLRRERGVVGAAALVTGGGAAALIVLSHAFGLAYALLMGLAD